MNDFVHTIDGNMILYTQKEKRLHVTGPSEVCTRYSSDYDHHNDNHHYHDNHLHHGHHLHHLDQTEIDDNYNIVQSLISIDNVNHKIATNHTAMINPSLIPVIDNDHNHHQLQPSLLYKNYEHFYHHGYFILSSIIDNDLIDNARQYINNQYISWLKQSKRQDDWRCHLMLDLTSIENNNYDDRDEVDGGEVVVNNDVQAIEHPAVIRLLLQSPMLLRRIELLIGCKISGIFYTQIAFRTPIVSSSSSSSSSSSCCCCCCRTTTTSSSSSSSSSSSMNRYAIVDDKVTTSIENSHNHKSSSFSTTTTNNNNNNCNNNNTINKNTSIKNPDYHPGAEYHLDGNANAFGIRFPDPWTVLVGIALVDITAVDMGNFTVFPGRPCMYYIYILLY